MGLQLKNPVVASASPLWQDLDNLKRLEDAGAAAVVLCSIFEEQLEREAEAFFHFQTHAGESYAEATSYFPRASDYRLGSEPYLDLIRTTVSTLGLPVIASINGTSNTGWIDFATKIEQAGAHGLELNMYYLPTDMALSGSEVEERYLSVVKAVRESIRIPLALKVGPYFSSLANMAARLDAVGLNALVLFNRFYQPDFDLDARTVMRNLDLSTPAEIRLPLLWIAVLHGRTGMSLAATTGVESAAEVVKFVMAGADAVMTTSALLRHGIDHARVLVDGLRDWMERKEYASVTQMKGSMSQRSMADPEAFQRANYIRILEEYKNPYSA